MLINPAFSDNLCSKIKDEYKLPDEIIEIVKNSNKDNESGSNIENRTQKCFTKEIKLILNSIGLDFNIFSDKIILDICAGQGFLSYHILKNEIIPKELYLADINEKDLSSAKTLLSDNLRINNIKFNVMDVTKTNYPEEYFDIVIGNSFLHHMYDVPQMLSEIKRILKKDGIFICLHEPTISSMVFEYRNPKRLFKFLIYGKNYLNKIRYTGEMIQKGGGSDVWMFDETIIKELIGKTGFKELKISSSKLIRSVITSYFKYY